MERTRQDYLNLLDETVSYYAENPLERRAYTMGGGCQYKTKGGNMCAVGRCLDQDVMDYEKYNNNTVVRVILEDLTDSVFKEQYQGFNLAFWVKLQNLHDNDANWTYYGLSDRGKLSVKDIKYFITTEKDLVVSN